MRETTKIQNNKKRFVVIIGIALISLLALTITSNIISARAAEEERLRIEEENRIRAEKTEELKTEINEIYNDEQIKIDESIKATTKGSKNYGVYYQDLTTGQVISYNENKYFTAASTVKVALVLSAADLIQEGKLSLDDRIVYQSSDYEGGTGILQGNMIAGKSSRTVGELIELTITHSDNIATQMLKRVCEPFNSYILRITGIPRENGENRLNARQLGILLKRLYDNEQNNPVYETIIGHMKNTIFHNRLDKYLPYDIVAHKIGDNVGFVHDTAIIYTQRPYSLTVMTESIGSESMAKLSQNIYNIKIENDNYIEELKEKYNLEFGVVLE